MARCEVKISRKSSSRDAKSVSRASLQKLWPAVDYGCGPEPVRTPLLFPPAALTRRPGNVPHSAKAITYGSSEWTQVECSTGPRRRFLRSRGAARYKQVQYGVHGGTMNALRMQFDSAWVRWSSMLWLLSLLTSRPATTPETPLAHQERQQPTVLDQPLGPCRPVRRLHIRPSGGLPRP